MDQGERLRAERERLGYSQTAFAELAGAKKHAQINWEKGLTSPNAQALEAWSRVGLDVLFVVTGQGGQSVNPTAAGVSPRAAALIDAFEQSDEMGKKIIEGTASLAAQAKKAA